MPAPDSVLKLCETFADHRDHYRSGGYNEAQLRKEFLDPFFAALGWDMDNAQGLAPQYRDVIHEDALRIGPHVKAPDCAFTLHGQRKFFLEAKKPAVNIKSDTDPAFQLRRYAWSAKMPLSILSDFEEFAIYDTRIKPAKGDPSSKARTFYCTFDQYAEKWDEIAAIFSRDAILKGSFDNYADSNKKKKGTAEVDTAFLEEIERWRDLLARNLALRNPALSVRDLNFAVQKTIDRLVFLRICEDRGTEDYGKLRSIANGTQTYPRLLELFRAADQRYNSGLFHFSKEKGQAEEPDTLTPHLVLDDKVLKDIIVHLYYPDSPYEFSVLPADILGSVYEQFLGKVINLTAGHRAVVEDKPEVKKAGGVFYTPSYIVDYIVKQTVGPLIEGKTPKQIESIRVLDPACGSGSFLIVVYQFLLDWYHQFYISHDPEKLAKGKFPVLVQARGGGWSLTTAERKRILLAHVFGVDIDSQAVEVTKLSLLLKVLEGETTQSVQRELIHQRVLPDLSENIKCGNSLIASDFYAQPGLPEMDADAHLRVNVFDWDGKGGFPEIMKAGGFDAVVGNPPYIFTRELISSHERDYYASRYALSWEKHNTFMLFMEAMLWLLRPTGRGSFIVPNSWLTIESAQHLRRTLIPQLLGVVDFNFPVFQRVSMEPCIFVISGSIADGPVATLRIASKDEFLAGVPTLSEREPWHEQGGRISVSASDEVSKTFKGITERCSTVGECFDVKTGLQAYEKGKGMPRQTASDVANHVFDCWEKIDLTTVRYLEGKDVGRYQIRWSGMLMRYGPWLSQPRELSQFTRPRIVIREITGQFPKCLHASLTDEQFLNNKSILNVLSNDDDKEFLAVLMAVLNSKLISLFYKNFAVKGARKIFPKIVIKNLREFPFPKKIAKSQTDRIVALVEKMLDLQKQRAAVKTPHEQTALDRQISATDAQIDRLVYDLYGLTEEEIALVEGA